MRQGFYCCGERSSTQGCFAESLRQNSQRATVRAVGSRVSIFGFPAVAGREALQK